MSEARCPACGGVGLDTRPEYAHVDAAHCSKCGRWSTGAEIAMGRMLYGARGVDPKNWKPIA